MICDLVNLPDGTAAIVCSSSRGRRCKCGRRADLLCDWKLASRKSGTCDKPVCSTCTVSPAPDKDLCPEHAAAFREWQASRSAPEQNEGASDHG